MATTLVYNYSSSESLEAYGKHRGSALPWRVLAQKVSGKERGVDLWTAVFRQAEGKLREP